MLLFGPPVRVTCAACNRWTLVDSGASLASQDQLSQPDLFHIVSAPVRQQTA